MLGRCADAKAPGKPYAAAGDPPGCLDGPPSPPHDALLRSKPRTEPTLNSPDASGARQRLAAILSADAAGYSRLMAADEHATLAALDAARAVFRSQVAIHGGRVVDTAGDSVLAVFETATGAVGAALEVQRHLDVAAEATAADQRMRFRIGVHLGDVIEKGDGSVYGDGVNIAARLQALAPAGGVAVSDAVRGAVRRRTGALFEDLGLQQVKNIDEPVRAFRVHARDGAPSGAESGPRSRAWPLRRHALGLALGVVALAVGASWAWHARRGGSASMPPITMSVAIGPIAVSDATRAADAKAIAQALATGITAWAGHVRVITVDLDARPLAAVREYAAGAGARYLLEGDLDAGVQAPGVALRLGDVGRGLQVWSRRYALPDGGESRDVLLRRIVDDVAYAVGDAEVRRVLPLPVDRLDAMEHVVRSYGVIARGATAANAAEAHALLVEARRREPTLVPALLMMGDALSTELESAPSTDRERLTREFDEVSERAVALDPVSPIAWSLRASALLLLGRWTAALEAGERRLRLDPLSPRSHLNLAELLLAVDRPTDALAITKRAAALAPDVAAGSVAQLSCRAYVLLGDAAHAIEACERAGTSFAHDTVTEALLAAAYANAGQIAAAQRTVQALQRTSPGFSIEQLHARRGSDHPELLRRIDATWYAGLRRAGVPER